GLPRSGPFGAVFTDSRWINPVRRWKRLSGLRGRGRIQRGGRSPLIGRCGRRFLGGGHSRKCPPPERAFAYFSHERKVSQGTGVKPPKLPGRMAVTDEENFSPPPARRYANLSASVPIAGTEPSKRGGVRTSVLTPLCAYTCCSP